MPGPNTLHIVVGDEHTDVVYSPERPEAVKQAERVFNDKLAQGFIAYEDRLAQGATCPKITRFNPAATSIILVAPNEGRSA